MPPRLSFTFPNKGYTNVCIVYTIYNYTYMLYYYVHFRSIKITRTKNENAAAES